jgi:phage regulator Rha-like protein
LQIATGIEMNWIMPKKTKAIIPVEDIVSKIIILRGNRVTLDRDLAVMYGVETKQLKRSVRRHIDRFPNDFMFQLSNEESRSIRRQFGTLKRGAHSKYPPMAFTEQGVAMLSSVLSSQRAVEVNISIIRAFVHLRRMISNHTELAQKLGELEEGLDDHDEQILRIFEAIKKLIKEDEKPKRIGYIKERRAKYGKKGRKNMKFVGSPYCIPAFQSIRFRPLSTQL